MLSYFRVQKSSGKGLASVFGDSRGDVFIDDLEKGKTIIGEYYSQLLTKFL